MDNLDTELKSYYLKIKDEIKKEHVEYLGQHPEIRELLNDFMSSLLLEKPGDVYDYAKEYFSFFNKEKEIVPEKPLVLAGPSGVGKGTIVKWLLQSYPDKFELSVSYTTRQPREGEVHGKEYFFVTQEEFNQEIAKNSFLEYCDVHGKMYGTHKGVVRNIFEKGKVCILEIDVKGAEKIHNSGNPCNFIFLKPPTIDVLKTRLIMRGTDKEDAMLIRLKNADGELKFAEESHIFGHKITNDVLEITKKDVKELVNKLYPHLKLGQ